MDDPDKGDPVTPGMDVYKAKIQSDESLDKFKVNILVRVDLHNKEMIRYTWHPTAPTRTLNHLLEYDSKHKARVHQLDFIGSFIHANVKHIFFEVGQ